MGRATQEKFSELSFTEPRSETGENLALIVVNISFHNFKHITVLTWNIVACLAFHIDKKGNLIVLFGRQFWLYALVLPNSPKNWKEVICGAANAPIRLIRWNFFEHFDQDVLDIYIHLLRREKGIRESLGKL